VQAVDHVSITVRDLARAEPFYDAVFAVLGLEKVYRLEGMMGFGTRNRHGDDGHSYLSVFESPAAAADPRRHWCFRAADATAVRAFHAAGLAAGGKDAGAPGLRPHYHEKYYAAFLEDPEGNRIEAVCHDGG
jgi:catechol 2,3-dioxygenase-like lactoylglutathione lyase family enzyme